MCILGLDKYATRDRVNRSTKMRCLEVTNLAESDNVNVDVVLAELLGQGLQLRMSTGMIFEKVFRRLTSCRVARQGD